MYWDNLHYRIVYWHKLGFEITILIFVFTFMLKLLNFEMKLSKGVTWVSQIRKINFCCCCSLKFTTYQEYHPKISEIQQHARSRLPAELHLPSNLFFSNLCFQSRLSRILESYSTVPEKCQKSSRYNLEFFLIHFF